MTIQQCNTQKSSKEIFRFTDEIYAIDYGNLSPENDKKIIDLSTAILRASKSIESALRLENSIIHFSRKCLAGQFIEKMDPSQLCGFHKRIWKVWKETTFDWTKDPEFGKHFLEDHPENLIVTKAIQEECRWRVTRAILKYLSEGQIDDAKDLFSHLPVKDQWAIERKTWQTWTKKTDQKIDDPLFGKHYLDKCFLEKRADAIVFEAFDTYLQESSNTSAGFFFKIKDPEGKTRGYALATLHYVPAEFLKFRPNIQKAFAKCNAFFPEVDDPNSYRYKEAAKRFTSHFGQKIALMDTTLMEKAKMMGKQVMGLESASNHSRSLGIIYRFLNKYSTPALAASTAAESWQSWEKGNSNALAQDLHRTVQYDLAMDKHEGSQVLQDIFDRNITMSDQMDKALNEKSLLPFFAAGCSHFPDNVEIGDGLVSLLAKKGWSCIPA